MSALLSKFCRGFINRISFFGAFEFHSADNAIVPQRLQDMHQPVVVPKIWQLLQNYRTHAGILRLASTVVNLICWRGGE